jgi:hypothetical protein
MSENIPFLVERLRVEGEKAFAFFDGLSPEQWQFSVYAEGELWTVRNVLSHYVTAEKGFVRIFNEILTGGTGVTEDFDIDRYNASQQKKTMDLTEDQLLAMFKEIRSQMILLVASMSNEDLLRQGRHPYLGYTTLGEMIKMVYRHNQIHFRDLRKILE